MIVLLVLLPALIFSEVPKLDWSKCGRDTRCFCPKSASDITLEQKRVLFPEKTEAEIEALSVADAALRKQSIESIEKLCEVAGLQNKFFSDEIALYQMRVSDNAKVTGLEVHQKKSNKVESLFGCEFTSGKAVLKVQAAHKKIFRIKLFEDRSQRDAKTALCAVIVKRNAKLLNFLQHTDELSTGSTLLKIIADAPKTYNCENCEKNVFEYLNYLCNPYAFQEIANTNDVKVTNLKNKDNQVLKCDDNYSMKYKKGGVEQEIEQLECIKKGKSSYYLIKYARHPEANPDDKANTTNVEDPQNYVFYCAASYNELCKQPACTIDNSPAKSAQLACPEFAPGSRGNAASLKCPDDYSPKRWLIDDKLYTLDKGPTCERDSMSSEYKAEFYFDLPTGKTKPANSACFKEYDCAYHSHLVFTCSDDDDNAGSCKKVVTSNNQLKCANDSYQLTVTPNNQETGWNDTNLYECNKETGLYGGGERVIPLSSRVQCHPKVARKQEIEDTTLTEAHIYGIIGGSSGLIIVIIVVVTIAISINRKRKSTLQVKGRNEWRNLKKKKERIDHCKAAFAQIVKSTADTSDNLIAGLDLIDTMLDAGTEDAECWEEAYVFLKRFQGSILKLDHQIWHMFSRYMFLQAKKIIDKHDWIAPKPIRRKSRKGLIRAVAIQLLSFAMFDPTSSEAEELLFAGFKKLRFDAAAQYPHCGLLWSVLLHVRPLAYAVETNDEKAAESKSEKAKPNIVMLNRLKFADNVHSFARRTEGVVPKEEVIPEFGSVAYQAAFALGAAPYAEYHEKKRHLLWKNIDRCEEGNVQRGYFAGLCETVSRDPIPNILFAASMFPAKNRWLVRRLRAIAPTREDWEARAEKAINISFYYGRAMDAKRLQSRFLYKRTDLDAQFTQMMHEQQDFNDAMEYCLEKLRKWFAKRTDMEELKKKPVYLSGEKWKLDNQIPNEEKKDVEGGTKSSSASSEGSNSASENPAASPAPTADSVGSPVAAAVPAPAPAAPAAAPTPPLAAPAAAPASKPAAPIAPVAAPTPAPAAPVANAATPPKPAAPPLAAAAPVKP